MAVAACLALSATPEISEAAGLGKIVVYSALGQPLRAEIELTATREELSGMKAQLAAPEAFKQAGLDYATTLTGIRFSLDKRPGGQSIIRLTSSAPINDPFVDMLLELNWPTGRLVREYTFLLDPPEVAAKNAQTPVATVVSKAEAPAATSRQPRAIEAPREVPIAAAPKAAEKTADGAIHEVRRGDTLGKIARANKPEGVSLEQMLVGLLRANQDAFDGGNMNRLKSGKILSIPEKSALEAIAPEEAKKVVVTQASDWNAYRSKLAAVAAQSPAREAATSQESSGKITAKVEDKVGPASEPKDQLKVSKSETGSAKGGVAGKRSAEDQIAHEKALKEANERATVLEKNVANLQKLLELKDKNLAELQKQAADKGKPAEAVKAVPAPVAVAAKQPDPVPAPVAAVPAAKPEPAPVTSPAPTPVAVPAVAPADKPVDAKPAEPVSAVKPEEPKPATPPAPKPDDMPKPKPKPVAPPPPPEPSFFEELLDNPLLLAGGGGLVALLGAYAVIRRRRSSKEEPPLDVTSTMSPPSTSLTANSVFRSTGGQSVDTSHTPAQTDFSQAGPGSIDTDEVDPVAEADVYMAYGRDAQAEEILIEAKLKDPKRFAIHLKLLEIYSNRKDTKVFETVSTELYGETGGVGADWEKAAAMGIRLDPSNPLYGGSGEAPAAPFDPDATVIVSSPTQTTRSTVTLPGELSQIAGEAEKAAPEATPAAVDLTSLDFDLGLGDAKPAKEQSAASMDETLKLPEPVVEAAPLDFDLAAPVESSSGTETVLVDAGLDFNLPEAVSAPQPVAAPAITVRKDIPDLDFDLGVGSAPQAGAAGSVGDVTAKSDDGVEFDVSLTESTFLGRMDPAADVADEPLPAPQPVAAPFDMSSIDLDLDAAPPSSSPQPAIAEPASVDADLSFETQQVSTSVNLDFQTAQAETVVNPQFGMETELAAPDFELSTNEEVATKLDLAKAYEEMGDLEGARELLQEVIKEGDSGQREKAQAILTKISA